MNEEGWNNCETVSNGRLTDVYKQHYVKLSKKAQAQMMCVLLCIACALNCAICATNGAGLCDTCNTGYAKTAANLCGGMY